MPELPPLPEGITIVPFRRTSAREHLGQLIEIAGVIRYGAYESPWFLDERFVGGACHNTKWKYSFVAMESGRPVGAAIGYEYIGGYDRCLPDSSIHLGLLAVCGRQNQGIGSNLLGRFIQ